MKKYYNRFKEWLNENPSEKPLKIVSVFVLLFFIGAAILNVVTK